MVGTFGSAAIVIRGHSDPTRTLIELLKAGLQKGILRQVDGKWYMQGKPLDLGQTTTIAAMIRDGAFEGAQDYHPRRTMDAALNLSLARAQTVKDIIVKLAEEEGILLDATQLQPVGVGISDPVVPVPTNETQQVPNRRVEFLTFPDYTTAIGRLASAPHATGRISGFESRKDRQCSSPEDLPWACASDKHGRVEVASPRSKGLALHQ